MYEELVFGFGAGAIIGFFATYLVRELWLERKIKRLQTENEDLFAEIDTFRAERRGINGNVARREKAERMESAMIEFALAMKAPGANVADILKGMALKYPDIALSLAKKGGLSL